LQPCSNSLIQFLGFRRAARHSADDLRLQHFEPV
jgi:hypothetical protein